MLRQYVSEKKRNNNAAVENDEMMAEPMDVAHGGKKQTHAETKAKRSTNSANSKQQLPPYRIGRYVWLLVQPAKYEKQFTHLLLGSDGTNRKKYQSGVRGILLTKPKLHNTDALVMELIGFGSSWLSV